MTWYSPDSVHSGCGAHASFPYTQSYDGNTALAWGHIAAACNHWIAFDLAETKAVSKIRLFQGADTYWFGKTSGLNVYVSDDPESWGDAVWSGELNAEGWQETSAFSKSGRYIKVASISGITFGLMYEFEWEEAEAVIHEGAAVIAGAGTLTASWSGFVREGAAVLGGGGALGVAGTAELVGAASLAGEGTIAVEAWGAVAAFWRAWFGPSAAPGKFQVNSLTQLLGSKYPTKTTQSITGLRLPHGIGYCPTNNRVFISTASSGPAGILYDLVRINPDNLSDYTTWTSGENELWGVDLCVCDGMVYVVRTDYEVQGKTYVDVFDASDATPSRKTSVEIASDTGQATAIDTDGTVLFVGTVSGWVHRVTLDGSKYPESPPSHSYQFTAGGNWYIHGLRYDSQGNKVFVTDGTYDKCQIGRVDADDLANPDTYVPSLYLNITDDMAMVTDYVYVGCELSNGNGRIIKFSKTDLSDFTFLTVCRETCDYCYGVFEEPNGDYVWALFCEGSGDTNPGELVRVKVSDNSTQRWWIPEPKPNELVFCGSKDKFLLTTWDSLAPFEVIRIENAVVDDSVKQSAEASVYSYWRPIRLFIEDDAVVDNLEVYTDGDGFGTGIDLKGNTADKDAGSPYVEPTGTPGEGGDELTTTSYPALDGAPVDVFGWTEGSPKTLDGSTAAKGDVGDFLVLQMIFAPSAGGGATPTEILTLNHDDHEFLITKTATVYGVLRAMHTAAALLDGSGTLAASGARTRLGAASLAGEGSLAAIGVRTFKAVCALAGAGALTVAAVVGLVGASSVSGEGALQAAAVRTVVGTASTAGEGTLTAAAQCYVPAAVSVAGEGTLSVGAVRTRTAAVSSAGEGILSVQAVITRAGAASLSGEGSLSLVSISLVEGAASAVGDGSLTVAGVRTLAGVAPLAGDGTLTVNAVITRAGAASLEGQGALAIVVGVIRPGVVSLSGSGTLTIAAQTVTYATASLSGEGTLGVKAATILVGAASLSGEGTLIASMPAMVITDAIVLAAQLEGAADLGGSGTLTGTGICTFVGAASLAGDGTAAVSAVLTSVGTASLAGEGSLTVAAQLFKKGVAALAGEGTLSVAGVCTLVSTASLAGEGTLGAASVLTLVGAAAPAGEGTLTVAAITLTYGVTYLEAVGTLVVQAVVIRGAAASLEGEGTLAVAGARTYLAVATLSGEGALAVAGVQTVVGVAPLAGEGTLQVASVGLVVGEASLHGQGSLTVAGVIVRTGPATLSGSGTLTVAAEITAYAAASLSGTGSLTVSASPVLVGAATLSGSGTIAVAALCYAPGAIPMSATGTLGVTAYVLRVGVASLSGEGILQVSPVGTLVGEASLSGDGVLAVSAALFAARASLSGEGTLTPVGVLYFVVSTVSVAGEGVVTVRGWIIAAAVVPVGYATADVAPAMQASADVLPVGHAAADVVPAGQAGADTLPGGSAKGQAPKHGFARVPPL